MSEDHIRGVGLDRLDRTRRRSDAIPAGAAVVPVRGHRALIRDHEAVFLDPGAIGDGAALVLLGERAGRRYAAWAAADEDVESLESSTGGRFTSLRRAGARLPEWQAGLLFYAAGILAWHDRARHCGVCGAPTRSERSGHQRVCTAAECGQIQFPRSDPAIITLIRRGERALLVHQTEWPDRRFSTLAGFVEPGETLEQALEREVAEEVALGVERTAYFASQPWPFPHTLMVGFRTEAAAGDVVLGEELSDARWFTRSELRDAVATGEVVIPEPYALSRSLIDYWLEER